jgi:hypothetical protein
MIREKLIRAVERSDDFDFYTIYDKIHSQKEKPLNGAEVDYLIANLDKIAGLRYTWMLLITAERNSIVARFAERLVPGAEFLCNSEVDAKNLQMPLKYLLEKGRDARQCVERFRNARSSLLRMAVAEYEMRADPRRGLLAMAEILQDPECDHETGEVISQYFSLITDPSIRKDILDLMEDAGRQENAEKRLGGC